MVLRYAHRTPRAWAKTTVPSAGFKAAELRRQARGAGRFALKRAVCARRPPSDVRGARRGPTFAQILRDGLGQRDYGCESGATPDLPLTLASYVGCCAAG